MNRAPRSPRGGFRGKKVTVVGLGTFGGGVGAARFFVEEGADVLVTDLRRREKLLASLGSLEGLPIRYRLGENRPEDVSDCDLAVFSPAVPPASPLIRAARAASTPITSPLNILWDRMEAYPIGVTGTRGKTTTTALLTDMIRESGRPVFSGGNIGGSLLGQADRLGPDVTVVLELSSFQLHWLRELSVSPKVSVITNFSPHHLDWHEDSASYATAKRGILEFQASGDAAILNRDDPTVREWGLDAPARTFWFSTGDASNVDSMLKDGKLWIRIDGTMEAICAVDEIPIRGKFQPSNVMAAALAARAVGIDLEAIRSAVLGFRGLPHRLERVATLEGVEFFNDSKATTPAAAAAAIESLEGPIHWIGGGKESDESIGPIARAAAGRVAKAYLFGEAGPRIAREIESAIPLRIVCKSLEEAVRLVREEAKEGCTILLSPGCASYDQYLNYEERGDEFKRLVIGVVQ
ncbi:MAG: UDP-N-acetylmuramoyl-L-alanine--D-glutamate ligase [Planctomycetota bacterium]|nr:UDP-N-acetylmuramoyl-L-alanine--D-glutamate ligase [Planctomycetota bacterium]